MHSYTYENGKASVIYNRDCLEAMKSFEDNQFDLAIVDPPYGVAEITGKEFSHGGGKLKNRTFNQGNKKINAWDFSPSDDYFDELFRVSKNQIIWGGNYFNLPPHRCTVVWDKCQPFPNFSSLEMAWTSFNLPAKLFRFDNRYSGKIHPTQKPVDLYEWLLHTFAQDGDKILDTHLGSGSSRIACAKRQFDFTGFELDSDYFNDSVARFEREVRQKELFV